MLEQRIASIQRHAEYGPEHVRGVAEAIAEARRRQAWGDQVAAEYFISQAEAFCRTHNEQRQA